jgi:hypothetical protein
MCVTSEDHLRLSAVEIFTSPFDYFISREAFNPELADLLLGWLETSAPWNLVISDFYEQYEVSFWDVKLPSELNVLLEENFIDAMRAKLSAVFDAQLSAKVDVVAHKLIPGQRIRLHNDFIFGQETHRLLIQLNRGWADTNGGLLILFNSSEPSDIHKAFRPVHNSALAFAVSPKSNHAVSTIRANQRFTLVYSFFAENRDV